MAASLPTAARAMGEVPPPDSAQRAQGTRAGEQGSIPADLGRAPAGPAALTAIFSGDVMGEIGPCGCRERPTGGLARRASMVAELRDAHPEALHLDAGNLLFPGLRAVPGDELARRQLRALALIDGLNLIGIDAANVGPYELASGWEWFERATRRAGFPFLSANLYRDGAPLLPTRTVVERAGRRIGITGVFPEEAQLPRGVEARDPRLALREELATLAAEGVDQVVILSSRGAREDRRLARRVRGWGLWLSAGDRRELEVPQRAGRGWLGAVASRGRSMGVMSRGSERNAVWLQHHVLDEQVPPEPRLARLIDEVDQRLLLLGGAPPPLSEVEPPPRRPLTDGR